MIENLFVAVTTCPRQVSYLDGTLESLAEAGFDDVQVFHDPYLVGVKPAFRSVLHEFCESSYETAVLFEDDIRVALGLRQWLCWPESDKRAGVVSLYASEAQQDATNGQYGWLRLPVEMIERPETLGLGVCAVMMSREAAQDFLDHDLFPNAKSGIELGLMNWCLVRGWDYWWHKPSLVEHIGERSASHLGGINRYRRAGKWIRDLRATQ